MQTNNYSVQPDKAQLEKQIADIESNALAEEIASVRIVYSSLKKDLDICQSKIPFPDVDPYDTANNPEDISVMNEMKSMNAPYWADYQERKEYYDNDHLYIGHVRLKTNDQVSDYYFMESPQLKSKNFTQTCPFSLINVDDKRYATDIEALRNPSQVRDVLFSRKTQLVARDVKSVEVLFDSDNSLYSDVTDVFLRNALKSSKSRDGLQSIIMTIQKKQDMIRTAPVEKSLAVQGCAGSGKTMILLHRIRYLLYNQDIIPREFILITPSHAFQRYIGSLTRQFRIPDSAITPIIDYYRQLLGKNVSNADTDSNELLFDEDYLSTVYNPDFIRAAYRHYLTQVDNQANEIISICEEAISNTFEQQEIDFDSMLNISISDAVSRYTEVAEPLIHHFSIPISSIEDMNELENLASGVLQEAKSRRSEYENAPPILELSDDDERISSDPSIDKYRKEIENETDIISRATVFTKKSHQQKLERLKRNYETELNRVKKVILVEEQKKREQLLKESSVVFEGITIDELETTLSNLKNISEEIANKVLQIKDKKANLQNEFAAEHEQILEALNSFIDLSGEFLEIAENNIRALTPINDFLMNFIHHGIDLVESINSDDQFIISKKSKKALDNLRLFTRKTDSQIRAQMKIILFNKCRKMIKENYQIIICDLYKHFWYLNLYCHYLSGNSPEGKKHYIFIDECQDLSVSEIELINKLNTEPGNGMLKKPVLNVFGDINQVITHHGIKDWSSVKMIDSFYSLNENFRNPSQIVDFCNQSLPIKMQKVGVDMDPVSTYSSIPDAKQGSVTFNERPIIIVKDEYVKQDLTKELAKLDLTPKQCYTVKEVKGLEFQEVFVVDQDMTENEKYIAYTRPLIKLNVIHHSERIVDRIPLYVQGTDSEENEELL